MEKIIDPIDKALIKAELKPEVKLRDTNRCGNEIYIVDYRNAPNTLREIGRLREMSYRPVQSSLGLSADLDEFDYMEPNPYNQMIVWDPESESILGGYRILFGDRVSLRPDGQPNMSSSHIFHYSEKFIKEFLPHTMEQGRAFVTPEYQGSKAGSKSIYVLDNLFDGLMALMVKYPQMKYYLGKMTIYPDYDKTATALVTGFLSKYFSDKDNLAQPYEPYTLSVKQKEIDSVLKYDNYKEDYLSLKKALHKLGISIPPIINTYMGLSSTMRYFGFAANDTMNNALELGAMTTFADFYDDKKSRHVDSYLEYLDKQK